MAQPAPGKFRLTEHQTNDVIFRLEERKYGHRLNSMELAQKANVSLDYVNCVENQRPIDERHVLDRIANALGINADLLCKIAGFVDMTQQEWETLHNCMVSAPAGEPVPHACELLGFKRIWQ